MVTSIFDTKIATAEKYLAMHPKPLLGGNDNTPEYVAEYFTVVGNLEAWQEAKAMLAITKPKVKKKVEWALK